MRVALRFLAERRWAGVGLALVVEISLLVGLALAPPSAAIGIPAAVTAGIAGTVAVVFGVLDGIALSLAGALVFAALGGWGAGQLAAVGVWPGVVAAVGLFARRVERQRSAFREVVNAQERERRSLALELHDQSAQTLTAALISLRTARRAHGEDAAAAADNARDLIVDTIQALRELAIDLSPKALADYGLAPALERLARTLSMRSGLEIRLESDWDGRLPAEAELALFRIVQAALGTAVDRGARSVRLHLSEQQDRIVLRIRDDSVRRDADHVHAAGPLAERLRLLGGRLTVTPIPAGTETRAELPAVAVTAESGQHPPSQTTSEMHSRPSG